MIVDFDLFSLNLGYINLKTAVICHHPAAGSSFMPFSGGKTGSILL